MAGKVRFSVLERFTSFVMPEPNTGCWIWLGHLNAKGYGRFRGLMVSGRRERLAHRTSYRLFKGEIPEGKHIDHMCRRPFCVNPDHLRAVTLLENNRYADHATNHPNKRKTHCKQGHPFDAINTGTKIEHGKWKQRRCRTCDRLSQNRRSARVRPSKTAEREG